MSGTAHVPAGLTPRSRVALHGARAHAWSPLCPSVLSAEQRSRYGVLNAVPDIAQLGAFFHLDADDRRRAMAANGARNQLGWSVQHGTAWFLNCVLDDPEDVPPAVVHYVAEQLGLAADVIGDIARERPSPKSRTALPELRRRRPMGMECGGRGRLLRRGARPRTSATPLSYQTGLRRATTSPIRTTAGQPNARTVSGARRSPKRASAADRHARSARTAVRKIPPPRREIRSATAGRGSTASFLSVGLRLQAPAGPL